MRDLVFIQAEIWKDVPDYENSYQASNLGRIRSLDRDIIRSDNRKSFRKGRILSPSISKKGYYQFRLNGITTKVHRIIAITFILNPLNLPQVNHKDGNKLNNNDWNLEWCTNQENKNHAVLNNLIYRPIGEANIKSTLLNSQVINIKNLYNTGLPIKDISEKLDIKIGIIRNIIYGRTWKSIDIKLNRVDERFKYKVSL